MKLKFLAVTQTNVFCCYFLRECLSRASACRRRGCRRQNSRRTVTWVGVSCTRRWTGCCRRTRRTRATARPFSQPPARSRRCRPRPVSSRSRTDCAAAASSARRTRPPPPSAAAERERERATHCSPSLTHSLGRLIDKTGARGRHKQSHRSNQID